MNHLLRHSLRPLFAAGFIVAGLCAATITPADSPPLPRIEEAPAPAPAQTRPATRAALPPGSRVTLKLTDAKPQEAFAALSRQIDYDLAVSPRNLWDSRPWPAISVNLNNATFWQASRELCEKAGVSLQRLGIERDVVLMAGGGRPWLSYPSSEHGPFLVIAQSLQRSNSVDLTQAVPPTRSCVVRLTLYGEPKVRILRAAAVARIEHAVDERGISLAPPPTSSEPRPSFTTGWTWSVIAHLAPPAEAGDTIAELRGRIVIAVQTDSHVVHIPDIQAARNLSQKVGGHQLIVKEVRKTGSTYVVSLTLHRDPASAATWRDISPGSFFKLLDAQGQPLSRRSYGGTGGGSGDSVDLSLTFAREDFNGGDAAGEPATLVWEVPTEVTEHSVPFVFRNLPLP